MNEMNKVIDALTKKLADEGRVIEAGWQAMRLMVIPRDASEVRVRDMRKIFFAGAQHLYASILSFLEPGTQETRNDLRRLAAIDKELCDFLLELTAEISDT